MRISLALIGLITVGTFIQFLWQAPFDTARCGRVYIDPNGAVQAAVYPNWNGSFLGFLPAPSSSFWGLFQFLPLLGITALTVVVLWQSGDLARKPRLAINLSIGAVCALVAYVFANPGYVC